MSKRVALLKETVRDYVTTIPTGEWNYSLYRRRVVKSMGPSWDTFEYVCQLPYIRAVTGPIGMVIGIPLFLLWIAFHCIKETLEGR